MSTTALEFSPLASEAATGRDAGFLARTVRLLRAALRRRHQLEELARMDDKLLLDIGFAEDEIWRVRAREDFIPRAWAERRERGLAA